MDMLPDRLAYPRVDALLQVEYRDAPAPGAAFKSSDGGISFRLQAGLPEVLPGNFVELVLCFQYGGVEQKMQCIARCVEVTREDTENVGVFQFINAPPEISEGVRSMACLHLLRINRDRDAQHRQAG